MTEEQQEFFINIGIAEDELQYCYFSQDEKPFTPLKDKDGKILKTGEQVYNEWVAQQNQTTVSTPSDSDRISALENAFSSFMGV